MASIARFFNGPDSEVITSLGSVGTWGAATIVAICKRTVASGSTRVLMGGGSGVGLGWTFQTDSDMSVAFYSDGGGGVKRNSAASRVVQDRWHLLAVTKASGTTTPRFHIYDYTTLGWIHENGGGTQANAGPTDASLWHGQDNNSSGAGWTGEIQAMAWWNSELSDGTIEGLTDSWAQWAAASPAAGWIYNQASAATDVLDEIGTADETSTTGTTIGTGNPDWDDSLITVVAAGAGGMARPGRERGRAPRREQGWW